jgi:hypothetical protein
MSKYLKNMLVNLKIYELELVGDRSKYSPDEIIEKTGYYYKINDKNLTPKEINTAILAKQASFLKTIKNIALFYFCLTVSVISIYLIYLAIMWLYHIS